MQAFIYYLCATSPVLSLGGRQMAIPSHSNFLEMQKDSTRDRDIPQSHFPFPACEPLRVELTFWNEKKGSAAVLINIKMQAPFTSTTGTGTLSKHKSKHKSDNRHSTMTEEPMVFTVTRCALPTCHPLRLFTDDA